jgi:dTDP-4-amino-4,6-dideoxygalactose transaminase
LYAKQLAEMEAINEIAFANDLLVIEAAQAHGATLVKSQKSKVERRSQSLSDAAAFSFTLEKNLGALGDGGAVVTNDYELSRIIQSMRIMVRK